MDFQLALLLAVVGVIVIGFIYFDAKRRSKSRRDRIERELYEARIDNTRDKSGFDSDGVSQVRVSGKAKPAATPLEPEFEHTVEKVEAESERPSVSDDSFQQAEQEAWQAINQLPDNDEADDIETIEAPIQEKVEPRMETVPEPVIEPISNVSMDDDSLIDDEPELIQEHIEPEFNDSDIPVLDDALFEFNDNQPSMEEPVETETVGNVAKIEAKTDAKVEPIIKPKRAPKIKTESPQQSLFDTEDDSEDETVEKAPELIFSFFIVADAESSYQGKPLVHCLLEQGMRHGDMGIFHRHSQVTGRGPIQFSLANAFAPGTFDLDNLDQLETRGLALFMALPGPSDAMKAYDLMIQTARKITTSLGGQLLDASKTTFSSQIEEHHKEQIREYERQQLLRSRQ